MRREEQTSWGVELTLGREVPGEAQLLWGVAQTPGGLIRKSFLEEGGIWVALEKKNSN